MEDRSRHVDAKTETESTPTTTSTAFVDASIGCIDRVHSDE